MFSSRKVVGEWIFSPLCIGISVATFSGVYLRHLLSKEKEKDIYENLEYDVNKINIKVPESCFSVVNDESQQELNEIQQQTGTKITLRKDINSCTICTIEGVSKNRERAKAVIYGIIANHFANLSKELEHLKKEADRDAQILTKCENDTTDVLHHIVRLPVSEVIKVFVSSIINPDCFWVQLIETKVSELEDLEKEINAYYLVQENAQLHALGEVSVNDLVAAPFNIDDDNLYRARVVEIVNGEQGVELELFYVDYGDDERIQKEKAFSLKPEFSRLKFQAVQCSLANIQPMRGQWSTEAVDFFCSVTDVAKWKVMEAEVVAIGEKGEPVLKLFEMKNGSNVNVAHELVRKKYAYYSNTKVYHAPTIQKPMVPFVAAGEEYECSEDEFEFG